ncbi:MAG: TonB-dependent receptor, partial [Flavobacteriales bacterium]
MPAQPKLTLAVALLAVCTVGQGQSALEDSVLWRWVELTDAVVTGERDGTSSKEALRMIRTVDEKSIAASGASQLNQLLNSQLNFRISQDPILGSGAALNGLGGEGLTVLVDGVPVRGRLNGQVDLSQLSLNNVERVEIVNGPMAVEYGTNALAGTINLITKSNHREYETIGQHEFNLSATHSNGEGRNLQASINQYYFDGWSPTDALIDGFAPFLADTNRTALWNPKLQRTARIGGKWKRGDWIVAPAFDMMHETI